MKTLDKAVNTELYTVLRDEVCLRIGQQNRCIDQSILITTGLAAAFATLLGTEQYDKLLSSGRAATFGILALFLYTLVHELLLANYIYQTWILLGISRYVIAPKSSDDRSIIGGWERDASRFLYAPLTKDARAIYAFQPGLVYASIGIGSSLLAATLLVATCGLAIRVFGACLLAGVLILLGWLARVHLQVTRGSPAARAESKGRQPRASSSNGPDEKCQDKS